MLVPQGRTREDAAMPRKKDEDQAPPALAPRYLKLDDVANYLSVSVPQVYSLVRAGELPAIKIGGRGVWRVDRNKLDVYLEKLEEETAWVGQGPPTQPSRQGRPRRRRARVERI